MQDIFQIRRLALINVMNALANGNQTVFAQKIGKQRSYVSRLISETQIKRKFSGDYARELEAKLELPPLYLDQEENAAPNAIVPRGSAVIVTVKPLVHPCVSTAKNFAGVPVFSGDLQHRGLRLDTVRAVVVEDFGMQILRGIGVYTAIVNTADTARKPVDGDVFLIEHGNKLKLRRICLRGDAWVARSDLHGPDSLDDITIDAPEQQIVGALVFGGGFLRP